MKINNQIKAAILIQLKLTIKTNERKCKQKYYNKR